MSRSRINATDLNEVSTCSMLASISKVESQWDGNDKHYRYQKAVSTRRSHDLESVTCLWLLVSDHALNAIHIMRSKTFSRSRVPAMSPKPAETMRSASQ